MTKDTKDQTVRLLTPEEIEALRQEMTEDGVAMRRTLAMKQPRTQPKPT